MKEEMENLQARIHWRCLSWFKALKWPSANEADFGDFLVVYDFKKGETLIRNVDGTTRMLASFEPQSKTSSVSEIEGEILCGGHALQLGTPFVESGGVVQLSITPKTADKIAGSAVHELSGSLLTSLRYEESFCITPMIEGRDVYTSVDYTSDAKDLAIFVTSLLVFSRFSAQSTDVD